MKTPAAVMTSLLLVLGSSTGAHADHQRSPDALAHVLKRQAREIYIEVATHFRTAGNYRRLVRTAYDLYEAAEHVEDAVGEGWSSHHVRHDLQEVHDLLECLEEQALELNVPRAGSLVGHRGWGVHPEHVQHLCLLIGAADDTLHQLEDLMNRGPVGRRPGDSLPQPGGVGPYFGTPPAPERTVPGGVRIPLQFGKQGGFSINLVLR